MIGATKFGVFFCKFKWILDALDACEENIWKFYYFSSQDVAHLLEKKRSARTYSPLPQYLKNQRE
jgi:hypothetical protein